MSKTYILEPTEMEFVVSGHDYAHPHVTIQSGETGFISSTTVLNDGCFVDVAGTAYPFAMKDGDEYLFSPDISAENPQVFGIILNDARTTYYGTFLTDGTTYEVSVYTEDEDSGEKPPFTPARAGLPDMNVTLNYENPTNNGIALVTKALMYTAINLRDSGEVPAEAIAEINDILYNPGYAPMERLVRAYVANHSETVDPYAIPEKDKANYVVDFANDWERLAFAICPDMFAKPTTDTEAPIVDDPSEPSPGELQQ